MSELETTLRAGLDALADEVPPSHDPLTEQRRRLAARTSRPRRTPALAAAAAALLVLAGVGIPLTLDRDGRQAPAAGPASTPHAAVPPEDAGRVVAGPYLIDEFTEDGRQWRAWTYVLAEQVVCVTGTPKAGPPTARHPNGECAPLDDDSKYVWTRGVLRGEGEDVGPLPDLLLFVTDRQVHRLVVDGCHGQRPGTRKLGGTDRLSLYVASVTRDDPVLCFGYTAYDAKGKPLISVIT